MTDRLLVLWIALLGATRIDLFAGAGPFVLTPFLALSPVVVVSELKRLADRRWQMEVRPGTASLLLWLAVLLVLLLASTALSWELPTSARRFALLLVQVALVFVVGLGLADRAQPGRILFRGAVLGLALCVAFSLAQLGVWVADSAGSVTPGGVVELDPRNYLGVVPRLTGASHDANLGGLLILFYVAVAALFGRPSRLRTGLIWTGVALIALTLSRSAGLAGAALWGLTRLRQRQVRIGPAALGTAAALLGAVTVLFLLRPGALDPLVALGEILGQRLTPAEGSTSQHAELLARGWEVGTGSVKRVLLGIGYGNAHVVLQDIFPGDMYGNFHSLFVTFFAEAGAVTALVAVWIFARAYQRGGDLRPLVAGLVVFNLFQQAHTEPLLWLSLLLAWLGIDARRRAAAGGTPEEAGRRSGARLPAGRPAALLLLALGAGLLASARPAPAQEAGAEPGLQHDPRPVAHEAFAGGELERYLRALQNVGRAAPHPWSVRGLSAGDVGRLAVPDSAHPWAGRYRFGAPTDGDLEYGLVRPRALAIYNTGFPYGGNDGPLWAGRGLTAAVRLGGHLRWGPVSLVVAPVAFRAGNRAFELAPTGLDGDGAYRSPVSPGTIDLPQRFGPDSYARLDLGESTLRLDLYGVAAGVSTAAQQWGASEAHPLVLGPNAGGFPHAFVGTERPVDLWIGSLHGRVVVGRLEASEWAPSRSGVGPDRVATGLVAAFRPRGLPGLEVGFTRFHHFEWTEEGIEGWHLRTPFETVVGERRTDTEARESSNELGGVFVRWNVPGAGVEVFGELVKEDGIGSFRLLMEEPDDLSGYALGLRRAWEDEEEGTLTVLRAEALSTVSSHRLRGGARLSYAQRAFHMYKHSRLTQGHTHRGQLLASPAGHGGRAATVGLDRYHPGGRWSVEWERRLVRDRTAGITGPDPADVEAIHALGVEAVRFTGPVDLQVGLRGIHHLNRHLEDDAFSLRLTVGGVLALP